MGDDEVSDLDTEVVDFSRYRTYFFTNLSDDVRRFFLMMSDDI